MCGRLNVSSDPVARVFIVLTGAGYPGVDQHNVAPTETVWVITERADVDVPSPDDDQSDVCKLNARAAFPGIARPMRWWLVPHWSDDSRPKYAMFNARAESLQTSRAFRGAFERRRCIVPVDGFYEWLREGTRKLPQHVQSADGEALLLAGVWDRWVRDEQVIESFAVVTTDVHANLKFLHNRQPVLLAAADALLWLDAHTATQALQELLTPALPTDLQVTPVSDYVNNARHKGPECLTAAGNPQFVACALRALPSLRGPSLLGPPLR